MVVYIYAVCFLLQGTNGRLHYAVHEPGYFCTVPEADKAATQPVQFPVTAVFGCLDIHGDRLSWCFSVAIHLGTVCLHTNNLHKENHVLCRCDFIVRLSSGKQVNEKIPYVY